VKFFNFGFQGSPFSAQSSSTSNASSTDWWLIWGKVDTISEAFVWRDDRVAIAASQVAVSPTGRFVVVGDVWLPNRTEIFEHEDIPYQHWQSTDLQFVAYLWERYGFTTWEKLIGAFALAVWDRDQQTLWLGRDRSGVRTLYYTTGVGSCWIAPKLRTLTPHCPQALDLVALRDYLCCAFVPGERTLWQYIREVRPGSSLQLPDGKIRTYWALQERVQTGTPPSEGSIDFFQQAHYADRLRSLLNQVIQDYLPQGEPVGTFLSGGLDSSYVTALAAKFYDAPVHAYSIHFGAECPNELEFSSLVAAHCQTDHHILEISFHEMWNRLPETMAFLDDPIGDPLTVPNLLLGRMAGESVRVVLNGEGGDPCFGGPKNQPMLINALYGEVNRQNSLQAYLLSFQKCASDLAQLLKPDIWATVREEPSVFSDDLVSNHSYLNRLMGLNIKFKGADHILTKVNNLTHAAGIEGRSPLFDQRVVELSMQIPPEYKLSGVQEKAVLKQAVADLLPDAVIQRPKSGMMVPVQLGFRKYWNRQAKALLLTKKAAIVPYLNQSLIRNWLDYQGDTWNRYGVKLWLLVSLELWLQANGFR